MLIYINSLNKIIIKCFKKIRINCNRPNKALENLFTKKEDLKKKIAIATSEDENCEQTKEDLEQIGEEIAALCEEQNKEVVQKYLGHLNDPLEGFNVSNTWSLKKKLAPKNTIEPPMAKKDSQGNLITDQNGLEQLYLKTYVERLKPNQIKPGLETLEEMKELLFKMRLEICKDRKSKWWEMDDLEAVLKSLKDDKARDAHGHTYELFKYGGRDLKLSLLKLLNLVKEQQIYPSILQPSNITSLYKSKGEKSDLNNDRGIFNVVKVRSILDKLIYNEKYELIDSNMSCSIIGARKGGI